MITTAEFTTAGNWDNVIDTRWNRGEKYPFEVDADIFNYFFCCISPVAFEPEEFEDRKLDIKMYLEFWKLPTDDFSFFMVGEPADHVGGSARYLTFVEIGEKHFLYRKTGEMSYETRIEINTGGTERHVITRWNVTYNLRPMLNAAFNAPYWVDVVSGKSCSEALPLISEAVAVLEEYPDEYRKYNAPNGWGDYDVCLRFVKWLHENAAQHPLATIEVIR